MAKNDDERERERKRDDDDDDNNNNKPSRAVQLAHVTGKGYATS